MAHLILFAPLVAALLLATAAILRSVAPRPAVAGFEIVPATRHERPRYRPAGRAMDQMPSLLNASIGFGASTVAAAALLLLVYA